MLSFRLLYQSTFVFDVDCAIVLLLIFFDISFLKYIECETYIYLTKRAYAKARSTLLSLAVMQLDDDLLVHLNV